MKTLKFMPHLVAPVLSGEKTSTWRLFEDFEGHEKYKDQEDMLSHYKSYYGDKVTLDTVVKMVDFELVK